MKDIKTKAMSIGQGVAAGFQKYLSVAFFMAIYTAAIFYGGMQYKSAPKADMIHLVNIPTAQAASK